MKTLFLTLLTTVAMIPARGETPSQPTVNRLLQKVRAELPKGWTTSYEKQTRQMEISRVPTVRAISAAANSSGVEKPRQMKFAFAFQVMRLVTLAEYAKLDAENAEIQKQLDVLAEELHRRKIPSLADRFYPHTPEEKEAVAPYEALKNLMHSLPDFYFEDISLKWEFNSPDNPTIGVVDDRVRAECTKVREKITKLLSAYQFVQR